VLSRWYGGSAAVVVTLGTITLVVLDLTDARFRHWWAARELTTDTVAGVLVLLVTVLVVDQLVRRRQVSDRSRAIAAQAAIVLGQALRSAQAVTAVLADTGDREAASDELRTYMIMLLVGAPVLIDTPVSRDFLEQAQHLGGEMARVAGLTGRTPAVHGDSKTRIDRSVTQLRAAAAPLMQLLDLRELSAAEDLSDPGSPDG
jgi:hypothetical protein